MLFNTPEFIVFLISILTIVSILKYRKFQHIFLLLGSYFFFYFTSNIFLTLLIASTILDYYVGKAIFYTNDKKKKKILLLVSLSGNLGLLGFFKYVDFGISQVNHILEMMALPEIELLELILPIGISFYTFQTISYTVDIYRGKLAPSQSLKEFALFVAFFPQLVAGPILRASQFLPQLRNKINELGNGKNLRQIIIENQNLKFGITLMMFGFFKKMFFADNIAPLVNQIFENPIGLDSFSIILGTIGFGIQIYCDFSGYTDIAIGAAMILGFKIPKNFNKPYFATSPSDFWRRWHISLSSWLRDYLYIPLGGNKKSSDRTFANIAVVMLIGGIWHGASWNFVIWGGLHSAYLIIQKSITKKFPSVANNKFLKTRFGKIISIIIVQYFIFLAWIPFRVRDFDSMLYSIEKYLIWDFSIIDIIDIATMNKIPIVLIVSFITLQIISYKKINLLEVFSNLKLKYWSLLLMTVITLILLLYDLNPHDFIYFRF